MKIKKRFSTCITCYVFNALRITLLLCSALNLQAQTRQLYFDFENINSLNVLDKISGKQFPIVSVKKHAESVTGFSGKGLRTDGYSTWINAKLPANTTGEYSISGWFALETFSTDTAGFFAIKNTSKKEWASACFDTYGRAMIAFHANGKTTYTTGDTAIGIYEWMHVALNITNNKIVMLVNGRKGASIVGSFNALTNADSLTIGRNIADPRIAMFPLSAMNGIMDEIVVTNQALKTADLSRINFNSTVSVKPDISVPAIRFADDFNRPKYHLIPAANWTNETHGLIRYNGRYHIFNQKDGNNILLRKINWGHFSSADLIHWTEHKAALRPSALYDNEGIWSGHAIEDINGLPAIVYTGGSNNPSICIASPSDSNLIYWKKYEGNPVVKSPPAAFKTNTFRDPYIFKENGKYYMIVGFGYVDSNVEKGSVILYRSNDLKQWEYLHPLFTGNPAKDNSGVFWEMPVFVKLNGKYVLLVNKVPHNGQPADALYWSGDFVDEKFIPDEIMPRHFEVVNRLLSPSVTVDESGLTAAIAIIPDLVPMQQHYTQGWAHLYSIPRVWTLKNNKLCQQPHPALRSLRMDSVVFNNVSVNGNKPLLISNDKSQLELEANINIENCRRFGFSLGKNASGSEFTNIYFDIEKHVITVVSSDSDAQHIHINNREGNYGFRDKNIRIRLLIDGSVVEGFINDEDAFTTRMFPKDKNSNRVELFCEKGSLQLAEAKVWRLQDAIVKQVF